MLGLIKCLYNRSARPKVVELVNPTIQSPMEYSIKLRRRNCFSNQKSGKPKLNEKNKDEKSTSYFFEVSDVSSIAEYNPCDNIDIEKKILAEVNNKTWGMLPKLS